MPLSTVSVVLKRNGVGKLGRIGLEQPVRYERSRPGEFVHIDIKKLGRIEGGAGKRVGGRLPGKGRPRRNDGTGSRRGLTGWEFVHVAVDDYSRLAYAEVLDDERATTATGFLRRAVAYLPTTRHQRRRRPDRQRLRLHLHRPRNLLPHARHQTPPHSAPPTADQRQSRTLHPHHAQRLGLRRDLPHQPRTHQALDGWLWHYNHRDRHSALGHQPPVSRTNLLGSYS